MKNLILNNMPKAFKRKLPVNIGIDLKVRDDDIFIVSYPRSGNTWMRFLVGTIYFDTKIDWLNIEEYVPDMYQNSERELCKLDSPRFIKSHHPYDRRFNKVIYLVRDVRDVIISNYHYQLKMDQSFEEDFDLFFQKFLEGEYLPRYGTWGENVTSWLDKRDEVEDGFLLVKFEDLKDETMEVLDRVINFLDLKRTEDEKKEAVRWCSFDNMKKLEKKQQNQVQVLQKSNKEKAFIRRGKSKQWVEALTKRQKGKVRDYYGELLTRLGYEK